MGGTSDIGRVIGRYVLYDAIAAGGMATIHLGRLVGQVGFARVVAIKRLHPHLAKDPDFVAMFLDEARVAAGISHPNVVSTLDVVALEGELFLVMDYVEGDSLSHLIRDTRRAGKLVDPAVVSAVISNACYGLHAAHNTTDQQGRPLHIVHRDVSPQNIQVGVDGIARVLDFGVAKAARRIQETEAGRLKGKFSYMAPEMVRHDEIDFRADVFSAGVCLWESLTGKFLFHSEEPARTIGKLLDMPIPPPSSVVPGIPPALDEISARALERNPDKRYQSARDLAIALEDAVPPAIPRKVGAWVEGYVGETLRVRSKRLAELASEVTDHGPTNVGQLRRQLISIPGELGPPPPASSPSHPIPAPPAPSAPSHPIPAPPPPAESSSPSHPLVTPSSASRPRPRPPSVHDDDEPTHFMPGKAAFTPSHPEVPAPVQATTAETSAPAIERPPEVGDSGAALVTAPEPPAGEPPPVEPAVAEPPPVEPAMAEPPVVEPAPEQSASSLPVPEPWQLTPAGSTGFEQLSSDVRTPISQVSDGSVGSVSGPLRRSLPPQLPLGKLVIAAAAVLGVLVIILVVVATRSTPDGEGTTAASAAPVPTASEKPKEPEPATTAPEPEPEPSEKPEPKKVTAPPKPSASEKPKPKPAVTAVPVPVAKPPRNDCNPPYTIDENGIKKFKRWCL